MTTLLSSDNSRTATGRVLGSSAAICRLAAWTTSALVSATFIYHLATGSTAYLGLLEDDYYYYAIIADKLVRFGRVTYDGVTTTNGFHPLWFVIIAALRWVLGRFGPAFYVGLTLTFLAAMIVTYELSRRLAMALGASRALAAAIAATYSLGTALLLSNGMESVVAVPLLLLLLLELAKPTPVTSRRAAKIGFLASIAILARLDIALIVPMFVFGYAVVVRPSLKEFSKKLAWFCAGGALLPLYAAANVLFFGSVLPVSAEAKRLLTQIGFSIRYARGVAQYTVYGPTVGILLPLGVVALVLLVRDAPRVRPHAKFVAGLVLTYAFTFFGINALTGWTLFGWYAFPLAPATVVALVLVCERWGGRFDKRAQTAIAAVAVLLAPALGLKYFIEHGPRWSVRDNTLLSMSYDLADHLRDRQGLFAMGAIGGIATYVIDKPVLQVEGIIADSAMVDHVRKQDPLGDVLRAYHADYLIVGLANARSEKRDGCYLVTQPNAEWAGTWTAKMRGQICAEPIAHFFTEKGANPWSVFPTIETLVWDLRDAPWRPVPTDTRASE